MSKPKATPMDAPGSAGASPSQADRRHPAHGVLLIENKPTIVFGTLCTKDRVPWLANDRVHEILTEVWTDADAWLLGRYVIMPDHIHFFAGWTGSTIEFDDWVKYWKSQFTKRYKRKGCRWQTDHWDTRMRTGRAYEEKWDYVVCNPIRHKLVERPEDWPYRGEIHRLPWD